MAIPTPIPTGIWPGFALVAIPTRSRLQSRRDFLSINNLEAANPDPVPTTPKSNPDPDPEGGTEYPSVGIGIEGQDLGLQEPHQRTKTLAPSNAQPDATWHHQQEGDAGMP